MSTGWQLVAKDPSWLAGPTVAGVIRSIADAVGARFVVVDEVEGGGSVRPRLVSPDLLVFPVSELVGLARVMVQFDWGDFFLVRTEDEAREIHAVDPLYSRVSKSLVAIRCVDDTYFYVYGTDSETRETVFELLDISETKEGPLAELDYPY